MHENFQRQEKITGSSDRSFGLVFAAVFALAAFLPLLRAPHQPRWWAAVVAIAFVLVGLLKRIFGSDSLRLQADRAAKSYWITRDTSEAARSSMKQQF